LVDRALAARAAEPRARAALAGELDRVLLGPGGRARAPRPDDPLPYVEAVIAETLRLWPPVRLVTRRVTGAFELGGRRFAPGWTCVVSIDVLHRDPRWWPDPERFLPERWLAPDEDGAGFDADGDRPRGAYLPFGAGPRRCTGELMGRQQAALVLAAVAGHRRAGRP